MKYIYDDRTQQKLDAIDKRMNEITEEYMKVLNKQLTPYLDAKAKIIAGAIPKQIVCENNLPEDFKNYFEVLSKIEGVIE